MIQFTRNFKSTLYFFLAFIVVIFCSVFSVVLTVDVWNKFTSGFTATGVRFQDSNVDRKLLPCLTVCPWAAFKKQGSSNIWHAILLFGRKGGSAARYLQCGTCSAVGSSKNQSRGTICEERGDSIFTPAFCTVWFPSPTPKQNIECHILLLGASLQPLWLPKLHNRSKWIDSKHVFYKCQYCWLHSWNYSKC